MPSQNGVSDLSDRTSWWGFVRALRAAIFSCWPEPRERRYRPERHYMRTLLGITIVATLVVGAWAIPHGAKQYGTVSIDPASLTVTRTNLPIEQYDAF